MRTAWLWTETGLSLEGQGVDAESPRRRLLQSSRGEMTVDLTRVAVWRWEKWSDSGCLMKAEPTGFADGGDTAGERGRSGGQLPGRRH